MESMRIEILNPKAGKLLEDLAELNLISIKESTPNAFQSALLKLRKKASDVPSLEEISKEVELVRSRRHARKGQ